MVQRDLKIITRLVEQHRGELSCLTAGEHADARQLAPPADISLGDVMDVLTGVAELCREKGWDFRALSRRITLGTGPAPA